MLTNITNISVLDRIKLNNGIEPLKNYYHDLLMSDSKKAINLINDENLRFSSLFILRSIINKFNLMPHLNERNKNALKLVNQILAKKKLNFNKIAQSEKQYIYILLKWIIETGFIDDGLNNQYDEVIDAAAILLIKVFEDTTILNIIVEMIFRRNIKKSFNYDLIWAMFESRDPKFLFPIAKRLYSSNWMDIELARKLLKFIPEIEVNYNKNNLQQYNFANKWLQDNYLFLDYTGEGFQQSSTPKPYILSLEAKYLCKPLNANKEKAMRTLSENEQVLLNKFKNINTDAKKLLSRYSFLIYRQNIDWWKIWINYPISDQIRFAKNVGGLR